VTTRERLIEALKYDERLWRAFELLKPIHRDGLLDALEHASSTEACELRRRVADLEDALAITTNSRETNRRRFAELRALGRRSGESLADYAARLDSRQSAHFEVCRDCNYDQECVACCADGDGGHSCSCNYARTDHGYGSFLRSLLQLASDASRAGVR
jgi:hypothetical protein